MRKGATSMGWTQRLGKRGRPQDESAASDFHCLHFIDTQNIIQRVLGYFGASPLSFRSHFATETPLQLT